jgi:polysaccharide biosynthesis/export protein
LFIDFQGCRVLIQSLFVAGVLALAGGVPKAGAQEALRTPVDRGRQAAAVDPTTTHVLPTREEQEKRAKADPARQSGPQPLDSLTGVGTDYRIGANDLLEFDVFGVPDMKRTVRVNSSGMVSLPLVGAVPLAGLTAQQAEALLARRYGEKYLQNPNVSLFIKEFTTQRVTIEGAVLKPGIYPVTGQITLLRALALAGGYAQYADQEAVMLYRMGADGRQMAQTFNLEQVRAGDVPDPVVVSDDVIVVKRDARRTTLRDSLFRDIIDTINPFSNR